MKMNEHCKKILNALAECKNCKFYSISCDGSEEIYECLNEDRWRAEGYSDEDFEEDWEGEIWRMAVIKYNAKGEIIDCDFYGTCSGKYKIEQKEG